MIEDSNPALRSWTAASQRFRPSQNWVFELNILLMLWDPDPPDPGVHREKVQMELKRVLPPDRGNIRPRAQLFIFYTISDVVVGIVCLFVVVFF